MHKKVVGSIPSVDTYGRQLVDVSLSHIDVSLPFSLSKINKHIRG